jgi:hypothetical protein
MTASQITASLATIPSRTHILPATIRSLLPQVDRLNVYLNGFETPPEFLLREPKISVALSGSYGDRGDAGKFFWASKTKGYYFACDDDLIYPEGYTAYMTRRLDAYGRQPIVTLHGSLMNEPITSYYQDRTTYHCLLEVEHDAFVHVPGSGVCAFHTDHVHVSASDFKLPNMADIWLALWARANDVPSVVLAHPNRYLDYQYVEESIYRQAMRSGDQLHTAIINRGAPWGLPLAATERLSAVTAQNF